MTNRSIDSVTSRSLLEQAIQLSGSLKASILSSSRQSENPEAVETEVEVLSVKVVQPTQRQSLTTATKRTSQMATKKQKTAKKLEQENFGENPFERKFAEAKATIQKYRDQPRTTERHLPLLSLTPATGAIQKPVLSTSGSSVFLSSARTTSQSRNSQLSGHTSSHTSTKAVSKPAPKKNTIKSVVFHMQVTEPRRRRLFEETETTVILQGTIEYCTVDMLLAFPAMSKNLSKRKEIKYAINTQFRHLVIKGLSTVERLKYWNYRTRFAFYRRKYTGLY